MLLFFAVMALSMSLAFSTVAFANGRITATVNGLPVNLAGTPAAGYWGQLQTLIAQAQNYLDTTGVDDPVNAPTLPFGQWFAPQAAHDLLREAMNVARAAFFNQFAPGEEFDLTIGIQDNPGFAGFLVRLGFPTQLEVLTDEFRDYRDNFDPAADPMNIDYGLDFSEAFTVSGDAPLTRLHGGALNGRYLYHVGWAGRNNNFTGNGDLFTFRVRVRPGTLAASLPYITIALANAVPPYFADRPTDVLRQPVYISLPCGSYEYGIDNATNLVQIHVVAP